MPDDASMSQRVEYEGEAQPERTHVAKCGYLFKYRPYKFTKTWDLRYFELKGKVLEYYLSQKQGANHPRGLVKIEGCVVEIEGRKKSRFWVFSVVDPSGLNLLRMSSESEKEVETWVQALVEAGCTKRYLKECFRARSPLRSADIRWKGEDSAGLKRVPSNQSVLDHRWAGSEESAVTGLETADSLADTLPERDGHARRPRQPLPKDYASDSGMSESGTTAGPMPRSMTKRHSDMRGSTQLYTESRPSILSTERFAFTQHSGILNLMTMVLLATNARLILENLMKYGVLTNPTRWLLFLVPKGHTNLMYCWPAMALFALIALGIEKLGAKRLALERKASLAKRKRDMRPVEARRKAAQMAARSECLLLSLHLVNLSAVLVLPTWVVLISDTPVPSFMVIIFTITLWMKLTSYAHCNLDFRRLSRDKERRRADRPSRPGGEGLGEMDIPETIHQGVEAVPGKKVDYPDNLTLRNLAYFLVVPALVYQTTFPTSKRFRGRYIIWNVVHLLVAMGVLMIITEQYMAPTIKTSVAPLRELQVAGIVERLLKLAVPTLYGWLIIFYALFHVWLNILAEITYFGDREFYKDWWNATTIGDYWRLWNVPVHKWLLRHVYYPCIRRRVPKTVAAVAVFFVSAVFHEMLVGVPLHMVRFWAFWGLMFQVPLLFLTDYIKKRANSNQIGNYVFWFTFVIFGQPMAIMLYYHDWKKMHPGHANGS